MDFQIACRCADLVISGQLRMCIPIDCWSWLSCRWLMMCTLAAADNYRAHGVCSLTLSPYPVSTSLTIVFNCVHRCNQVWRIPATLIHNSLQAMKMYKWSIWFNFDTCQLSHIQICPWSWFSQMHSGSPVGHLHTLSSLFHRDIPSSEKQQTGNIYTIYTTQYIYTIYTIYTL